MAKNVKKRQKVKEMVKKKRVASKEGGKWFDGVWEVGIILGGDVSVKVFEKCGFGRHFPSN